MTMRSSSTRTTMLATSLLAAAGLVLSTGCASHPMGECGRQCTTIKAALTISHFNDRLVVLQRVAENEHLTQHEQTYVVNAICFAGFSTDKANALTALIANKACTATTRRLIADKLELVHMLGADKRRVVDALLEHGGIPASEE